jgi:hypothetical protein
MKIKTLDEKIEELSYAATFEERQLLNMLLFFSYFVSVN